MLRDLQERGQVWIDQKHPVIEREVGFCSFMEKG